MNAHTFLPTWHLWLPRLPCISSQGVASVNQRAARIDACNSGHHAPYATPPAAASLLVPRENRALSSLPSSAHDLAPEQAAQLALVQQRPPITTRPSPPPAAPLPLGQQSDCPALQLDFGSRRLDLCLSSASS